jgi:hypothetical protein
MLNALTLPILTIFLISGCATTNPLEVFTTEVESIPLNLDLPPVETLEKVNVIVITSKNQEEVFAKLKEQNIDPVLFAYTDEDWELVTKNNVRMRNQLIKLRAIIEAYKEYYEPEEQEGKSNMFNLSDEEFEPKTFNKDD